MLPVARDGQNASATLRQNRQLPAALGKAEKSWRIFRAKRQEVRRDVLPEKPQSWRRFLEQPAGR